VQHAAKEAYLAPDDACATDAVEVIHRQVLADGLTHRGLAQAATVEPLAIPYLAMNFLSERKPMVEVGQTAPDFELLDQSGEPVRLSELRGQKVVVYFYPKADTPGY
jgi:hypothetical protein